MVLCGINSRFQLLSPCVRQVTHALLTRPPLSIEKSIRKLHSQYSVRLACVKHAASVHPEPGSNSHVKVLSGQENVDFSQFSYPFTVCLYFRTLRNSLLVLHPSSLGMLRIPRSWASRGASRLGRPGSVCKSCPLSKLPVQSFHPSPGCWTLQKFQGCLYCLIFDFQGSRLISQPAQKEGFEPSRRYQRPTPFPGEPLQPLGYFCLRTNA